MLPLLKSQDWQDVVNCNVRFFWNIG